MVWACFAGLAVLVWLLGSQVWYSLNGWRTQAPGSATRLYRFLAAHHTVKEAPDAWFTDSGKYNIQSLDDPYGEVTEFKIIDHSESGRDEEIVEIRVKRKLGGYARELLYVNSDGLIENVNRVG